MIQTIRIYTQDIGMEFCMEICAVLLMKRGIGESAELLYLESIKMFREKENYKYLWILETETIR